MSGRWRVLGAVVALVGAGIAVLSPVRAADHLDGPRAEGDPAADITDVYAFMSPETPKDLVLIMNVFPFATSSAQFSAKVDYVFDITPIANLSLPDMIANANGALGIPIAIQCDYQATGGGSMSCIGPNNLAIVAPVGGSGGGMVFDAGVTNAGPDAGPPAKSPTAKLFAGPRSDPFFFDTLGFQKTLLKASTDAGGDAGILGFTGNNYYAGKNVLSIVLEIDAAAMFGADGTGAPNVMLAVAAHTTRNGS